MAYDPEREWPFLARDAELNMLTSVVEAGLREPGAPSGAVIVAAPGVGKTRLAREVAAVAGERGIPTLRVVGTRATSQTPYATVAHLTPDVVPEGDAAAHYRAVAHALPRDPRPMLVVDDAHLLDAGSAALVLHVALTGAATVIVTARRGIEVPDPITALWADGLAVRVDLQPLSIREAGTLLCAALGGHVTAVTVHRLAEISAGNILYLRELVRAAIASGALCESGGVWTWDGTVVVGDRLVDAVGRRLGGLSADDRIALTRLAVGEPLALSLAEDVAGPAALARLEAWGLIRFDDGACRLAHPLFGDVLLTEQGRAASRAALRTVVDAAERLFPGEDLLRRTTWRLQTGMTPPADELLQAARLALAAFDVDRAAGLAEAALDGGVRADAEARVILAGAWNRQMRFADAADQLARAEGDVLAHGSAALRREWLDASIVAVHQGLGRSGDAECLLVRAESAPAATSDDCRLARSMRANILVDDGRLDEAIALTRSVLDEHAPPDYAAVVAASSLGEAEALRGLTRSARDAHRVLYRLRDAGVPEAQRAGDYAGLQELMCQMLEGHADSAAAIAEDMYRMLVAGHEHTTVGLGALVAGKAQLLQGRLALAAESMRDAVDLLRRTDLDGALPWALTILAQAEALGGRTEAAIEALAEGRRLHRDPVPARSRYDLALAEVRVRAATGDRSGAATVAMDAAEGPELAEFGVYRAQLLHAAVRLGADAARLAPAMAELAADVESDLVALLADVVVGRATVDAGVVARAGDRFEERGMRLEAMDAAGEAARLLAEQGRDAAARRQRARATRLAAQCGLPHGAPNVAGAGTGAGAGAELSRRERDVAMLAADGLSNAAIAERLVVSVRTVESHLYQAFGKLGVQRREELAAALRH
ncbi:helix-turn-helix transcriptional regulator [Microbacterium protaetiae]|uniref:Helix-turn-helix transcriptional regulator n=1 Tax=Microbacterium protaetiae TaxID=2509458 RepID=A0A4P6ECS9_9MICO|nr:LuxR C-terminal-related transcriptional regulator [Microbacterium protaetiae]QAY59884.1 helix-turn-helix transcriptional regulator [Microbacterium protaetiae]